MPKLTLCTGSGEQRWEVFSWVAGKGFDIIFGLFLKKKKKGEMKLGIKNNIWEDCKITVVW